MVKNTHGGSKHKSQARKASNNLNRHIVVEPKDPSEKYAKVTKMYGNGMCQVELQEGKTSLTCHIRGKFRGKNKKHNNVGLNSIVIVGLREWESALKNCDLIAIVENHVAGFNDGETMDEGEVIFADSNVDTSLIMQQTIPEENEDEDSDIDIDDI